MKVYVVTSGEYDDYRVYTVLSSEQKCIEFAITAYYNNIREQYVRIKQAENQLRLPLQERFASLDYHYLYSDNPEEKANPRWQGFEKTPDYYIHEDIEECNAEIRKYSAAIEQAKRGTRLSDLPPTGYNFEEFEMDVLKL